jgi:hypothetical protein
LKNAVFWDVTPYDSCKNRRFGGMYRLHLQGEKKHLLVTVIVATSSLIFVTLMMDAIRSSETSVITRATRRNIPEDGILHSHCRENLKSYISLTDWTV